MLTFGLGQSLPSSLSPVPSLASPCLPSPTADWADLSSITPFPDFALKRARSVAALFSSHQPPPRLVFSSPISIPLTYHSPKPPFLPFKNDSLPLHPLSPPPPLCPPPLLLPRRRSSNPSPLQLQASNRHRRSLWQARISRAWKIQQLP